MHPHLMHVLLTCTASMHADPTLLYAARRNPRAHDAQHRSTPSMCIQPMGELCVRSLERDLPQTCARDCTCSADPFLCDATSAQCCHDPHSSRRHGWRVRLALQNTFYFQITKNAAIFAPAYVSGTCISMGVAWPTLLMGRTVNVTRSCCILGGHAVRSVVSRGMMIE